MEVNAYHKMLLLTLRFMPPVVKTLSRLSKKEYTGMWCACWQSSEKSNNFEVGSMEIEHIRNTLVGNVYTADKKWQLCASVNDREVSGVYRNKSKPMGQFWLEPPDKGNDRLIGNWSGVVFKFENGLQKGANRGQNMHFCAARNRCVKNECRKKKAPFGICHGYTGV